MAGLDAQSLFDLQSKEHEVGAGAPSGAPAGEPTAPPKKRGRPKGSTNKAKESDHKMDWGMIAPSFCMPFNLALKALNAPSMTAEQEIEFTRAWGAVIDKYAPSMANWREEFMAVMVTATIFGPPLVAYYSKPKPDPVLYDGQGHTTIQ